MPTEFLILKKGRLEGPYPEEEVVRLVAEGTLSEADLGQTPQSYYWVPLRKLLGEQAPVAGTPAEAPRFSVFVEEIRERAWITFLHYPWESGLLCLGLGLLVAVLARWALLLCLPWLFAAIAAGAILFLRGRSGPGIALCAGAILLPIVVALLFLR